MQYLSKSIFENFVNMHKFATRMCVFFPYKPIDIK